MPENRYVIITDNTSDLPEEFIRRNALPLVYLGYSIAGKDYDDQENKLSSKEFYSLMRSGEMTKTNQANPEQIGKVFDSYLAQGYDILFIAFSSGLSGTCNSARIAAAEMREKYPERRIEVVDTLAASLGEGLLVYKALKQKSEGKSLEEVRTWLEDNKLHLCHMFTVDDLNFLHRGGRVSKTTAVVGTVLGIKPVLHVDNDGHLVSVTKVRGRKQALAKLVDYMGEKVGNYKNDVIFISHGDCEEDANYVADLVRERFGIQDFVIGNVGPTIGAHSGPGTVALFFLGEER